MFESLRLYACGFHNTLMKKEDAGESIFHFSFPHLVLYSEEEKRFTVSLKKIT